MLALAIAGCGGGGGSTETSTQRELLRDVPELRAASEGYGGEGSSEDPFDTTLVVQLPDGSFLCNDDTHGLNPAVQLEPVPSGQLRVWVGSYQEGQEGDYQMAFTTDRGLDASAIGPTPEE
ncbi:MAG: hypothetical protein IPH72_26940 [Sandaracinaceae bacterium]|nr:hypothetical protein [Sandaracinaceae bacterium]